MSRFPFAPCLGLLWSLGCSDGAAPPNGDGARAGSSGGGAAGGGTGGLAGQGTGGSSGGGVAQAGGSAGAAGTAPGGSGGGLATPTRTFVYLGSGSWDATGGGKLHVYELDETSAALTPVEELPLGSLNSFGAVDPIRGTFYVGDEVDQKVRAYAIDPAGGSLTFVNEVATAAAPVHVTLDASRKYLLAAYYNGGGVEVFSVQESGALGASVDSEQTGPQAHSVALSPDNQFAFVPNKGSDEVSQFAFDAQSGALTASAPAAVAGSDGPRHMAFHPDGAHAYLLNETDSVLTTFSLGSGAGTLTPIGSVSNVPEGAGGKASADVHPTPDGKFLYATNRDDSNTIAMYSIGADGLPVPLGHESAHGTTPRHFAVHPAGQLLLVANQESNDVASFRIQADGKLAFIETTDVGAAVFWVGFLTVPQ